MSKDIPTLESLRANKLRKRNIQLLREYLNGESFRQMSKRIGMSTSHIHSICQRLIRIHYSLGQKFPQHRLPDDIAAKLKEMGEP